MQREDNKVPARDARRAPQSGCESTTWCWRSPTDGAGGEEGNPRPNKRAMGGESMAESRDGSEGSVYHRPGTFLTFSLVKSCSFRIWCVSFERRVRRPSASVIRAAISPFKRIENSVRLATDRALLLYVLSLCRERLRESCAPAVCCIYANGRPRANTKTGTQRRNSLPSIK